MDESIALLKQGSLVRAQPRSPTQEQDMKTKAVWLILPAAIVVWAVLTYGLAKAGEPQSLWLWRDVFKVAV